MTLMYSAERTALQEAVRKFVAKRTPMSQVRASTTDHRGYNRQTWKQMADELGLAGLSIPEHHDGSGGDVGDLCVAVGELGAGLVPSPIISSTVLVAGCLKALGDEQAAAQWLPRLASAQAVGALAVTEPGSSEWIPRRPATLAVSDGLGHVHIHGTKTVVLDGAQADVYLVSATEQDGQPTICVVPRAAAGVTVIPDDNLDLTRETATVTFERVASTKLQGDAIAALDEVANLANLAMTAHELGAMRTCVEMATEYAKVRYSFGQPIGVNQGVKHRLADMYVDMTLADAALRQACVATEEGDPNAPAQSTAARILAAGAHARVARDTMLLHGGIGFTWEHDAHLFYRGALSDSAILGGRDFQLDRLAAQLGI